MSSSKSPEDSSIRPADSLLDSIARRTGRAPRVNLRDAGTGDETPIIDPKAHAFQNEMSAKDQGKYRILGEIARGGMGVVLRGHDVELGRDIAIKVTDGKLAKRPEVVERFVEEAQIGGQLQHPGIVPVYELGLMADQRPYFTMKLIKGRTLAAMLTRRKSVEEDRVGFLGILESVCQTMAYAHSKGVIHRDLKPANIMVGAFGEVQVVDWGLSKVLRRGGVDDEIEARDTALSVIETIRSGPGSGSDSLVGSVLGTPAYMSPEQAQGEPDKLDERTDVFAIGAILCEILTGAPPYVAAEGENLVQKAALGELDDARARIEASSAAPDLKKLCLASLLTSRAARPRDAEELATGVHAHLAGLESRAHEAQLAAAEDRLRAERSRRRSQLLVIAGVMIAVAAGAWRAFENQQRERRSELSANYMAMQDDALQKQRDGKFEQAVEIARGGLRLVETGDVEEDLRQRAEKLVALTETALATEQDRLAGIDRERQLFDFLLDVEVRQVSTGFAETDEDLDREYAEAFRAYGLDLDAEDTGEKLMAERDTDLGVRFALGFDGWSRLLRRMDASQSNRIRLLTGLGLDLDSDPLRTQIRLALVERDGGQLLEMAREIDIANAAPETLSLLAISLREFRHYEEARSMFVRGANRHPSSFLLNYGAGNMLNELDPEQLNKTYASAEGYLRTAHSMRPELIGLQVLLGDYYRARGNFVLASHFLDLSLAAAPDHAWNANVIGRNYRQVGELDKARQWFEIDAASPDANEFSESALIAIDILEGKADIEDYLAWAKVARAEDKWFPELGPCLALFNPSFAGLEPDPERALAILEAFLPDGLPNRWYWGLLEDLYLRMGNLEATDHAVQQLRLFPDSEWSPANRSDAIHESLNEALRARFEGDDEQADKLLARALWLRDELFAGMEEEWSRTAVAKDFDHLYSLAGGR